MPKIPEDMAAEIAENVRVALDQALLEGKFVIQRRAGDSFQDVVFWLLTAEATQVYR